MSSYDAGRCRREITAAYESTRYKPSDSDMLIADAIDRLAADVAAVRGAVCDRSGWPVGWLIEVDRLIRLRDEARAEVERLKADGKQAPDDLGVLQDARGLSERCKELASRIAMQKIESRAEKAWVKLVEEQRDAAIRERDAATRQLDQARRDLDGAMRGNTRLTNDVAALRARLLARDGQCRCRVEGGGV